MRCDAMRCDAMRGTVGRHRRDSLPSRSLPVRAPSAPPPRFVATREWRPSRDDRREVRSRRRARSVARESQRRKLVEPSRAHSADPAHGSAGFHVARGQFAEFFTRRELCSKISLGYLWINPRVLALGTGLYDVLVLIVLCQDFRVLADVEIRQSVETFFLHRGAVVRDRRLGLCVEQPQICEKESVQFQNMMITRTSILFPTICPIRAQICPWRRVTPRNREDPLLNPLLCLLRDSTRSSSVIESRLASSPA